MPAGRPIRSAELSALVIVLWLTSAAIVGVVGCIVLDRAGVGRPLPLGRALIMVLAVEILLYLLVLMAGGRGVIPAGRVVVGTGLGLIIRAGLSLIAAQLAMPVRAAAHSMAAGFGFYYAQYWPGALVQILAVSVFLWLIRDLWQIRETRWGTRGAGPLPQHEVPEDWQARREELLAALMEGPEAEEAEEAEPRQPLVVPQTPASEQLALLPEEAEAQPTEPVEAEEDTSRIPVVAEEEGEAESVSVGEAQPRPEEQRRQLSAAEELLRDAAGKGAVADTLSLSGGGGLVWAGPVAVDKAALAEPTSQLIDSAELLSEAAQMGAVELVVTEGEAGCWVLSPAPQAPKGWWVGVARAAPVTVGAATMTLRNVQADWPAVDLTGARAGHPPAGGILRRTTEYVSPPRVYELAEQWSTQVTLVAAAGQTAILIGPPGLSIEVVVGAGLQMWQAAIDLRSLLGWEEPATVLAGLSEGAVALGRAAGGREQPVLMVINRDSSQIAAAALRLYKLRDQF